MSTYKLTVSRESSISASLFRLGGIAAIAIAAAYIAIIGLVMLRGPFGKATAWVGIITGVLGIAAIAGVGMAVILNAVFATIWLVLAGVKLLRQAR